jgi:hypothetical protein
MGGLAARYRQGPLYDLTTILFNSLKEYMTTRTDVPRANPE